MAQLILLDVAPDPVGTGVLLAVVLLIIGFIFLLTGGLVLFLWFRKRSLRGAVMVRPGALPVAGTNQVQPSNPNQS